MKNIWDLFKWPVVAWLFYPLFRTVNVMICSDLGPTQLAGLGLGNVTLTIICESSCTLFACGCTSLMSAANGAEDYRLIRVYLNRQIVLNTMIYIITAIPLLFVQ
jgi:Na+-driven multidrug efflux pump